MRSRISTSIMLNMIYVGHYAIPLPQEPIRLRNNSSPQFSSTPQGCAPESLFSPALAPPAVLDHDTTTSTSRPQELSCFNETEAVARLAALRTGGPPFTNPDVAGAPRTSSEGGGSRSSGDAEDDADALPWASPEVEVPPPAPDEDARPAAVPVIWRGDAWRPSGSRTSSKAEEEGWTDREGAPPAGTTTSEHRSSEKENSAPTDVFVVAHWIGIGLLVAVGLLAAGLFYLFAKRGTAGTEGTSSTSVELSSSLGSLFSTAGKDSNGAARRPSSSSVVIPFEEEHPESSSPASSKKKRKRKARPPVVVKEGKSKDDYHTRVSVSMDDISEAGRSTAASSGSVATTSLEQGSTALDVHQAGVVAARSAASSALDVNQHAGVALGNERGSSAVAPTNGFFGNGATADEPRED